MLIIKFAFFGIFLLKIVSFSINISPFEKFFSDTFSSEIFNDILKVIFPIIHPFLFILSVPLMNSLNVLIEFSLEEFIIASEGIFTLPTITFSSPSRYKISIAKSLRYLLIESVGVNSSEWDDFISTSIIELSSLYKE